jgi:hypothetical protein
MLDVQSETSGTCTKDLSLSINMENGTKKVFSPNTYVQKKELQPKTY